MNNEEFDISIDIWQEQLSDGSDVYVVCARELEISSQGTTFEEAQENIREAVTAFLKNASEAEIEQYLQPLKRRRHLFTSKARVDLGHGQAQNFVWA